MTFNSFAVSSPGLVKEKNQTNLYINGKFKKDISDNTDFRYNDTVNDYGMYAIADGMSSEKHGDLAALLTVQTMNTIDPKKENPTTIEYLREVNSSICDLRKQNNDAKIASSFVGLRLSGNNAEIVNIGNSRAYLWRNKELSQLSVDHTLVQQMVDQGSIDKNAAETHPERHQLSQHLGMLPSEKPINPYSSQISVRQGDVFLLCSTGLTDMLSDCEINDILSESEKIEESAENLLAAANQNGGKENISIILVYVTGIAGVGFIPPIPKKMGKSYITIGSIFVFLLTLTAIIILSRPGYTPSDDNGTVDSPSPPTAQTPDIDNNDDDDNGDDVNTITSDELQYEKAVITGICGDDTGFAGVFISFREEWGDDFFLEESDITDLTVYINGVPHKDVEFYLDHWSDILGFPGFENFVTAYHIWFWDIFTEYPAEYHVSVTVKGVEFTQDYFYPFIINEDGRATHLE